MNNCFKTSNIEHRTLNIELSRLKHSEFDVQRSMFDVCISIRP
jgi:hypothetical protein